MGVGLKIALLIMMMFILPIYLLIIIPIIPSWFTVVEKNWLDLIFFSFWLIGFFGVSLSFGNR
jgi:hypothetical protein